jgi:DNA-binding NarL/FixJ family response regulator
VSAVKKKYRVVVVDDHALFRAGLVSLLGDMPAFEVLGEAENGRQALGLVDELHPDLILLDVNMPVMAGVETVRKLRQKGGDYRIVMLTISKQQEDLIGAIKAGADGYILKNTEPDDLQKDLLLIMAEKSVLSPEITGRVLEVVRTGATDTADKLLTDREDDVLACLARGLTTAQIADELVISTNTVKTHVRHIMKKLNASNRAEAVSIAMKKGYLE